MPQPITRHPRHSGGERVFTDDTGTLWSASYVPGDGALVFACISDSRQSVRALAVGAPIRIAEVSDEALRAMLREAPRLGRLI